MDGASVKESVRALCQRLDEVLDPKMLRKAVVIAAVPAVSLGAACMMYGAPDYGAPFEEERNCTDGEDNDHDGLVDCDDPDCDAAAELCLGCDDGQDNDGDGVADCDDPDCELDPACQ